MDNIDYVAFESYSRFNLHGVCQLYCSNVQCLKLLVFILL